MEEVLVIGDWVRDKILGEGSFGTVTLWRKSDTQEKLATKICRWGDDPQLKPKHKERWSKEVEMLTLIDCPNIVKAKDLPEGFLKTLNECNISKMPILCMEYCSGGDLRRILNKPDSCCGLSEFEVRHILNDLKNAISYLHQRGITHRDLKPENIVLSIGEPNSDPSPQVNITYKLIDLGYAKEIDYKSQCASFVGTLQYIAPELLFHKSYSNSVDFWSFGLVAFEITCGIRPFLPKYSTAQMIEHVKDKPSDIICIYENFKEEVEYSTQIFEQNHISHILKSYLEKWLRVALEWDPKKRGYGSNSKVVKFLLPSSENPGGEQVIESANPDSLIIFDALTEVLSKKILTVFSVYTFNVVSYEIDESVLICTVQGWIKRDINLEVESQLLIPRNCMLIKADDYAVKFWDVNLDVMLYLFNKNDFVKYEVEPKVPLNVRKCLELRNIEMNFNNMTDIYRNTYHFVLSEKRLFEQLALAFWVAVEHISNKCRELLLLQNNVDKELIALNVKRELLVHIMELDEGEWSNINNRNHDVISRLVADHSSWSSNAQETLVKKNQLDGSWKQIETRIESVIRRLRDLNRDYIFKRVKDVYSGAFYKLEVKTLGAFADFKKSENQLRGTKSHCRDATKCAYECLKLKDSILQTLRRQQFIQKIFDINIEISCINTILENIPELIKNISKDLMTILLNRQHFTFHILRLLYNASDINDNTIPNTVTAYEAVPTTPINFVVGDIVMNSQPMNFSGAYGHSCPQGDSSNGGEDIKPLIEESMLVNEATSNQMAKVLAMHKEMYESMDFGFLNEEKS